jgi:hypothetical protein
VVAEFLANHPGGSDDEAVRATGLGLSKIRRTRAWKEHQEALLARYLEGNPTAGTCDVALALGFSPPKVVGMRAWQEHRARREAARPPRRVAERPLTAAALACRPDPSSADPADRVGDRDTLFRVIVEGADPDTRARLNRLPAARQEALVAHVVGVMDGAAGGRGAGETRQLLVTVAQSWLDDQEQEGRRRGRAGRGP